MKRFLFTLISVLSMSLAIYAQIVRTIPLFYDEGDFTLTETGQGLYISTSKYTTVLKSDTLNPALPYICVNVLIGLNETYLGVTPTHSEVLLRENVFLARNPSDSFTNRIGSFSPSLNETTYMSSSYPDIQIEYTGTHEACGYKYLTFLICPFRYEAHNKRLYFNTNISLNLKLTSQKSLQKGGTHINSNINQDLFVNKDDIRILYEEPTPKTQNSVPYQYLIITTDALKEEFQRLADWKTIKGMKTKLLTIEEIYDQDTVVDRSNTQKIKSAIKSYYNSQENDIGYVLLGGGTNQVPTELCFIQCKIEGQTENEDTPADIYYGSLANIEWDTNHNGRVGEIEDSVNIAPDIAVSRLPACNVEDAKRMVDRIIDYEKNIDINNWKDSLLLCGVTCHATDTINGRPVSDAEANNNYLYQTYIAPNWIGNPFRFYDTYTDNPNGANYDVTDENLQQELSKGYSFVNVITHGFPIMWRMESGSTTYSKNEAMNLVNPSYTLISTTACLTNAFDLDTCCLGTSFLRNPMSGIVSFYGSSRESISVGSTSMAGISTKFIGSFYQELLLTNGTHLGDAVKMSKQSYTADYGRYNSTRWMYLTLNLLGDPEMPVFINRPNTFSNVSIYYNGDFLTVTGQVPYSMLCLASRYDRGNSYYFHNYYNPESQNNGLTFRYISDEYTFCLTQNGYIPYFAILGDTVHLQNETLKGSNRVIANNSVLIGSCVTDRTDEGAVIIVNGSTVVSCHGSVTITNDFEVKPGASFEIKANPTYYYE